MCWTTKDGWACSLIHYEDFWGTKNWLQPSASFTVTKKTSKLVIIERLQHSLSVEATSPASRPSRSRAWPVCPMWRDTELLTERAHVWTDGTGSSAATDAQWSSVGLEIWGMKMRESDRQIERERERAREGERESGERKRHWLQGDWNIERCTPNHSNVDTQLDPLVTSLL